MIPRNLPKRTFVGESVAEASFIASKGIDETKAPTQRDTLANIKNLEVNYDGSLSPRKPLILFKNLNEDYIFLATAFNGDYLMLYKFGENGPYRIDIIGKGTSNILYSISNTIYNTDVRVINTASSTIIQNCVIDSAENSELATFKLSTLNNGDWDAEKMKIEIDTLEVVNGNPQINPNLMLSNPFALRDKYDSYSVYPIGILPYIKGEMDDTNQKFIVDPSPTNDGTGDTQNTLTVKDLTEGTEYKIVESLPVIGNTIENFNHIFLKLYINNIIKTSGKAKYYIRWEKTTNGVYWEPANSSYENPPSGTAPAANEALIYVPNYVLNTSISEDDAEQVACLFKQYITVNFENDKVSDRVDILKITSEDDLNYSYRVLVYMVIDDTERVSGLTGVNAILNSVDGKTATETVNGNAYYIPDYDATKTKRTFSFKLTFNESLTPSDQVFDMAKFSCKVYARHSYNNAFAEVRSVNTSTGNPDWTISSATVNDVTITGEVSIASDLSSYPKGNEFLTKQCALHYLTYIAVYYNNSKIATIPFKEIIPLRQLSQAPSTLYASDLSLGDLGTLRYDTVGDSLFVYPVYQPSLPRITDSSKTKRLYKLPSSASFTAKLDYKIFQNSRAFYTIDTFHIHSGMKKLEICYRNRSSSGTSFTVDKTVKSTGYGGNSTIDSSNNSSAYNLLMSFFNGTADFTNKQWGIWVTDSNDSEHSYVFNSADDFAYTMFNGYVQDYLWCTVHFTKNVVLRYNNSNNIFSNTSIQIFSSGTSILYVGDNSYFNVSGTISLSNSNKYIWYDYTNSNPDVIFTGTNVKDYTYQTGSQTNYNDYSRDSYTYNPPNKYDVDWAEETAIDGFSVAGDAVPYTFIHNQTDYVSAMYLDLGCNDANKGYKLYWNHRIVSYGEFNNNILFSDSDSLVTPLLNTLTLNASQDTKITTVVPWRNYLLAATKEAIYLIYEMEGGFGHKAINTFIGIPENDRRTCKAILNGIIFKSNNKIYTLQPGMYSNDDSVLNIAEISQPIESLLSKVENQEFNFAISTSKYYYLFLPGYPSGKTTCFKYDYVRKIWTSLEFPVVLFDYIQTTEDELYLVATDNKIFMFEKDFTEYVKNNGDTDNDDIRDADIPYGDYLEPNVYSPINFVIDSGQKTDNISTTKQYVETKIIFATMDDMDNFPVDVDIYIDGIHFKQTHIDVNSDGAILKQEPLNDSLILGTNIVTRDSDLLNTFRQFILRYSGKGKSIRHYISGNSTYNFKVYVTYYRYKLTHNKQ